MRFLIASLFPTSHSLNAFDDIVLSEARDGGINRQLCALLAETYNLDLMPPDGKNGKQRIRKERFLKVSAHYRKDLGTGGTLRGWKRRAYLGAALDAITVALHCRHEEPTADKLQALRDAGQYFGNTEEWLKACEPVDTGTGKTKGKTKTKAEAPDTPDTPDTSGTPDNTSEGPTLADSLAVVILAIETGALSADQLESLMVALENVTATI